MQLPQWRYLPKTLVQARAWTSAGKQAELERGEELRGACARKKRETRGMQWFDLQQRERAVRHKAFGLLDQSTYTRSGSGSNQQKHKVLTWAGVCWCYRAG